MPVIYTTKTVHSIVRSEAISRGFKSAQEKEIYELVDDAIDDAKQSVQWSIVSSCVKADDDNLKNLHDWIEQHELVTCIIHQEDYTELSILGDHDSLKIFFIFGGENCNKRLNKLYTPAEEDDIKNRLGCGSFESTTSTLTLPTIGGPSFDSTEGSN